MKNKPAAAAAVLLCLCLLVIAVKALHGEAVPRFLIGLAGVLCGFLVKCIFDQHRNQQ